MSHNISCSPVNSDWFYLPGFSILVPAHPGRTGSQGAAKQL